MAFENTAEIQVMVILKFPLTNKSKIFFKKIKHSINCAKFYFQTIKFTNAHGSAW